MSKHTPGKLTVVRSPKRRDIAGVRIELGFEGSHGTISVLASGEGSNGDADARHLLACWNACEAAGLSTEALEAGALFKALATAQSLCEVSAKQGEAHGGIAALRAALAKLEGKRIGSTTDSEESK